MSGGLDSACPQFPLEALSDEYLATDQRTDFIISTSDGLTILELDGDQHRDRKQATIDKERDAVLANAGYRTLRVKVGDEEEFLATHSAELQPSEYPSTPETLAHALSVGICEGLRLGVLALSGRPWEISAHFSSDLKVISDLVNESIAGTMRHIHSLAMLLKLEDRLPSAVTLLINGERRTSWQSPRQSTASADSLHLHFNDIPKGLLSHGHLYYRIFPTTFPVLLETLDVPSAQLNPDATACNYFLRYFFRFENFHEGQWEGISRALTGKDALVLLPTGSGKSVIYQLVGLLRPGACIVIDPIVSLMEDQALNLSKHGITRCIALSSQMPLDVRQKAASLVGKGQFIFCFIAPERLQIPDFRRQLRALTTHTPISVVAIDEAHCVSEWGHDFRTSYLNLARNCREHCKSRGVPPPIMGLTGTASRAVLKDIKRELAIFDFDAIITPKTFNRDELKFRIEHCRSSEKADKLEGLLRLLPSHFGVRQSDFFRDLGEKSFCGIVFCPHVNGSHGIVGVGAEISQRLQLQPALYSGTNPKTETTSSWNRRRREMATAFKDNKIPIMVATKAFGMGIDKPNVRYTIHLGIPSSIESFYQEAGRAGRGKGINAICTIIASVDNPRRAAQLLSDTASIEEVAAALDRTGPQDGDDITRALFFQANSFKGVDSELQRIEEVLSQVDIKGGNPEQTIKTDGGRRSVYEKAVHRLLVIGLIADYTLDYSHEMINLRFNEYDPQAMSEAVIQYAANYQYSRSQAIREQLPKTPLPPPKFVQQLSRLLLNFIYDTVELSRRRALLEMVETCASGATDKDIRSRILSYLERSEFDDKLQAIHEAPLDLALYAALLDEVASPNIAKALRGATGNFLQDYPDSPGLLLLRGTIESMCPDCNPEIVIGSIKTWAASTPTKHAIQLHQMADIYVLLCGHIRRSRPELLIAISRDILTRVVDKRFLRILAKASELPEETAYSFAALTQLSAYSLEQSASILKEKSR